MAAGFVECVLVLYIGDTLFLIESHLLLSEATVSADGDGPAGTGLSHQPV